MPLAAVAAAVAALLLVGCAAQHAAPGSGGPTGAAPGTSSMALSGTAIGPGIGSVFGRAFLNPDLTVAAGSLYLTWELAPPTRRPTPMALARASTATGQILAENDFGPGVVSVPVYAAGSLWVTDSVPLGELLLRLDPITLMVTGELRVADGDAGSGADGHIAFAGDSIWVDGADRLVQVAPQSVEAERTIPLPGANSSHVGASPDGRTLIVSEAHSGAGTIQRRDPRTGRLLASHPVAGVSAPVIGGVAGAVAWIAEPSRGYVERIQTAGMTPEAATLVEGTGAWAGIWDGVLWVHSGDGGATVNYCADPSTGRRLAPLPLPDMNRDTLQAAGAGDLYYSYGAAEGGGFRIAAAPIPAACMGGRGAGSVD